MKLSPAAVLLLLYGANAVADSRAVEAATFDGGFNFQEVKAGGDPNHTAGVDGLFTFALASYLGASLSGSASHTNIEADRPAAASTAMTASSISLSCGFNSQDLTAGLFLRNSSIGRIGVSYGVGQIHSDCSDNATFVASDGHTLRTHNYAANAEYYFPQLTIGLARTNTHLDGGNSITADSLTAGWYPVTELRISPSVGRIDSKSSYGLELEGQPEFLGDALSVLLGYSVQRQTPNIKSFTIGFVYHFGKPLELQTRDRQYR